MDVSEMILKAQKELEKHDKKMRERLYRIYNSEKEMSIKIGIIGSEAYYHTLVSKLRDFLMKKAGEVFNIELVNIAEDNTGTFRGIEFDWIILEEMCKTQQSFEKVSKDLKKRIEEFESAYYYEEALPKKKKKRRMSRMERMSMYGGRN